MSTPEKTIEELRTYCETLAQENTQLKAELQWLKEKFLLAQKRQFGASSEKTTAEQMEMVFNEAEAETKPALPEPTIEEITYRRKKTKGLRDAQIKDLPTKTIICELPADQRTCSCCNSEMRELPEGMCEQRREMEITPAKATIIIYMAKKYVCKCEKVTGNAKIVTAPMPEQAFSGSLASPSLVSYIMTQKFVDGLPLYRQEQIMSRIGINLSRQTMANWMIKGSEWFEPLYDVMHKHLIIRDILQVDETTMQVLKEPGKPAESKSYLWLYRTGRDGPPIILYEYQPSRGSKHPITFLKGFSGYLNVDGYIVYEKLPNVILVGCWAHARRKFVEAVATQPPSSTPGIPTAAEEGLYFCNRLFKIEQDLHDVTAEERFDGRIKQSQPVLNAFRAWLENNANRILPKSPLGTAVTYCLHQWSKLTAFLKDGRLELDNNRSERSIKPFVIGRKNWLFANTPNGAKSSAIIYSIIETAKENNLNPFAYLTYLFEQLPNITTNQLDTLLPWSSSLPESIKKTSKPN